jgi:hypothetical protein
MLSPTLVEENAALALARDARIVAIRWDLIEWGLVLDLDVPTSECENSAIRRAWLVFSGVSEVTIPMAAARLPTGIWLTSSRCGRRAGRAQALYRLRTSSELCGNELRATDTGGGISIRAQALVGVLSATTDNPNEHGLSYEARTRLATDRAMLNTVNRGPA